MNSISTQSPQYTYQAVERHDEESVQETGFQISERVKHGLTAGAIIFCGALLYLFCFVLPSMFVPEACSLQGIVHVKKLGVSLHPVSNEVASQWAVLGEAYDHIEQIEVTPKRPGHDLGTQYTNDRERECSETQKERLVVVGDIHGQQNELHKLLKKVKFNKKSDTLLVLGDFISKGPRSLEVIDDLIDLDAKCILGNHEFYVLQNYATFHGLEGPHFINSSVEYNMNAKGRYYKGSASFNDDPEYLLAKKLEPRHIRYINSCPIMMALGPVPLHSKKTDGKTGSGQGVAVHAGLRWDLTSDLDDQSPLECMEMRSYIGPYFNETTDDSELENSISWSKVWNAKHKDGLVADSYVVYYGHDAHRGLNLKRWAKGLDTGCAKGEALTAMVIWQEKSGKNGILYKENTISVKC